MLNENKITVRKNELLEKLHKNLIAHQNEYEEACVGYQQQLLERLQEQLEVVRTKGHKAFELMRLHLAEPESHLDDYERVIAALEMSVSDEATLTMQQFSSYVLDDWQWKTEFISSTRAYRSK